jgi:co-chaperonin GroES (HSP10)
MNIQAGYGRVVVKLEEVVQPTDADLILSDNGQDAFQTRAVVIDSEYPVRIAAERSGKPYSDGATVWFPTRVGIPFTVPGDETKYLSVGVEDILAVVEP